jgi:hypothetical protein
MPALYFAEVLGKFINTPNYRDLMKIVTMVAKSSNCLNIPPYSPKLRPVGFFFPEALTSKPGLLQEHTGCIGHRRPYSQT